MPGLLDKLGNVLNALDDVPFCCPDWDDAHS